MPTSTLPAGLFGRFRGLILERYGIACPVGKEFLLEAKLTKLASRIPGRNLGGLYDSLLEGDQESAKLLLEAITVHHTFFFREAAHLDMMARDALARGLRNPTVWCAASSTGEEPYSIAMTLAEAGLRDFVILASDKIGRAHV